MRSLNYTRRDVLKGLVGSFAAPYVITSTALGQGQTPPASERVTLGHIGVGGRGRDLLRGFLRCRGSQSVAVADAYQSRREACAKMIGGRAYADFRELLDRPDIDAVVIATPDHWHVPVAMAAARAGKDCYVEKPLGLTVQQDLACRKLLGEKGRVFQYGTQQRSLAHCWRGCQLVRSGRIGKVHTIEVHAPDGGTGGSTQPAEVPPDLDYNMWIGPAPMKPYTVDRCKTPGTYWIYDYSIGYLGGWGAHPLDIMVWGSDADLAGPMTFQGTGVIPTEGLYDTVYHWDVDVKMADGVTMKFLPGSDLTRFVGTDGWVAIARAREQTRTNPPSLWDSKIGPDQVPLLRSPAQDQNFVDSVRTRAKPVSPLEDAVRSDLISHMCNIAIRTGRPITWDPSQEVIVNDPEASQMLSRPMRNPWTL